MIGPCHTFYFRNETNLRGAPTVNSHKILLIDDELIPRKVISSTLEHAGYAVHTCENGQEGLNALLKEPQAYFLIILDWMMPVMDGIAFLNELKKHPALLTVPVIMLTAVDDSTEVVQAIEAGAADYLTKPVDPAALLSLIEEFL